MVHCFQRLLFLLVPVLLLPCLAMAQPQKAFTACQGKQAGASCQAGPGSGQCIDHGRGMFCIPKGGPPQGSMQRGTQGSTQSSMLQQNQGRGPVKYPTGSQYGSLKETNQISTGGAFDTGQNFCFNATKPITCPEPGAPYYGQDAQYAGTPRSYTNNGDGTVIDNNTGLRWEKTHHTTRITQQDASRACARLTLGGHDDWRLPSAKELFSLMLFDGAADVKPYIDMGYFDIEPPAQLDSNDRFGSTHHTGMMGQTWTSTIYKGNLWGRSQKSAFFVNFLDGRIKCAATTGPKQFYRCVRGAEYGANDFEMHADGTVTDRSTGLVWQQEDDRQTRDWPGALAYCEELTLAGHDDWRLPNVKELQYILDYSDIPAIDETALTMTDPDGWYWASTTLGDAISQATYVCFGKGVSESGVDVHGAGAQRSDPKTTAQKHSGQQGGQKDEVRVDNLVRCVRK